MRYKQKQLKRLYNDPIKNFSKILDAYIYFKEIDDIESFEIVYVLFNMDSITVLKLLINDLSTRGKDDYNSIGYKHFWWLLSNDPYCIQYLVSKPLPEKLKELFTSWLVQSANKNESFYIKISKILKNHK